MADASIFESRQLNTYSEQGLRVLSCVGWPDPVGGMGLRLFCKTGTQFDAFEPSPREGCVKFSSVRQVNGGLLLLGRKEAFCDTVNVALKRGQATLSVAPPETALFAGMNCIIAERNGEELTQIEDWITYHVTRFGLEGVLLLDRSKANNNNEIERELQAFSKVSGLKRLVYLTCDLPLGVQGLPAASHPFNAPDAPGKDRMPALEPEPWHAPLGELLVYEIAKWRFLGRARAVANLDLTDLLKRGDNPFERVHNSSAGVIQLQGQRVYPWRLRKDHPSRFGDHICHQFDTTRVNRRWCLAPARLKPEQIWRLVRVTDATPQEDETAGFWRAMSIRHPESPVAEIVPKTSLVEDPELVKMAKTIWRHTPVRAPKSTTKPAAVTNRTLIVTCMKNEGPFILEWLAYHRAIGVDDFLIYTNDCTDGTDALLDALMARGMVQRRDNNFHRTGIKPQHWALAASEKEQLLQKAGWIISMDVDEFINIHVGEGRLSDLYSAIGEANMISLTWRLFGSADRHAYEDAFITDQFDRCAPELTRKPHQAWGFKTLFRNLGIYKKMGVHRPKGLKPDLWDQINWVNGSGQPMPAKLIRNGWRSSLDSYGYDLVTLNHYAVRSAESFLVKRDRGRVNHVDRDQGLSYWFRMNNNAEVDRSIQTKRALLRAEYDRLLADPELRALHEASVAHHRAKISELKKRPDYAQFFDNLTSARMERLSRLHRHFGANVFMEGPEVVPDAVAFAEDLQSDFFFTVERAGKLHPKTS
ncbi:MAG: glycosyltransferase family 2 protein [Litoreibacter sp.]|nr:glycosyltransferase family 2 protein [Litoreibacter sp.]